MRASQIETTIFDSFAGSAGALDSRNELRDQLAKADRLLQTLRGIEKFNLFDPLTDRENPVHLERSKLDELFKRKMMQQNGLVLMRIIRDDKSQQQI